MKTNFQMNYERFLESLKIKGVHRLKDSDLAEQSFEALDLKEPHYLLSTSGSENKKFYLHSLSSIEKACESFFKAFDFGSQDKWGLCLSTAHVAGFSILCRSYFGGLQKPAFFTWRVESIVETLKEQQISLISLVPTQVFDLCQAQISAPDHVKAVFVGGSALPLELLENFKKLGWPAVPCYGSTETFAQMSQSLDGLNFRPFADWTFKVSKDSELWVQGPGLYSHFFSQGTFLQRDSVWHRTGDLVQLDKTGQSFKVLGKQGSKIKIKGSYFDFAVFKKTFEKTLEDLNLPPYDFLPLALEEGRNGAGVYLVSSTKDPSHLETLMSSCPQIRGCFFVDALPRSEIGKIRKAELQDVLLKKIVSL